MESPAYHPQAKGLAERAVRTLKDALKGFETVRGKDITPFLQKILLHHRVTANSRGRSPSEILFGRKLRVPVVSSFEMGENVCYKPSTLTKIAQPAQFIMTKGHNTSYILKGEHLVVASNNQIAPSPEDNPDTTTITTASNEPLDSLHDDANTQTLRRSTRTIKAPVRYHES